MKNILVIGNTDSVFIDNLYHNLCEHSTDLYIHILTDKDKNSSNSRIKFYNKNNIQVSIFNKIAWFFKFPVLSVLHILLVKIVMGSYNPRTHLRFIKQRYRDYFLASYFQNIIHINTVHTQTIILENCWMNYFFKKDIKSVYSIWGSDLLRVSDKFSFYNLSTLLSSSDIITVVNINMKEFLLVKYGRQLLNKIRINYFILSKAIFLAIDQITPEDMILFKEKWNIPLDNKIILVGHSGDINDQHLQILKNIENQIDTSDIKQYTFILPLSYGLKDDYKLKLDKYWKQTKLNIILQTDFLSFKDLAILKRISNFVIMTPISDANSAFLIESIYAGSKVIVGLWLPYNHHRFIGLPMLEVENIDQIWDTIMNANFINSHKSIQAIKNSIFSEYFSNSITNNWLAYLK